MKYFRVQSNRVSITNLIAEFRLSVETDESLISPRPAHGKTAMYYFVLVCVKEDGGNIKIFKKFKNCKEITFEKFEEEKASIALFWSVKAK